MATYINIVSYPTGTDLTSGGIYTTFSETLETGGASLPTLAENIDFLKLSLEATYGGTLTWTNTTSGGNDVYTLTYVDPDVTIDGFPVSIGITDGGTILRSSAWSAESTPSILTDSCTECFEIEANECDEIGLNLGLVEGEEYTITITDKFGKMYSLTSTADADGVIYIDSDLLPSFLLNPYSGSFVIQVYLSDVLQQFVINNHLFGCFTLNIIAGTGLSNLVPSLQATLASDLDIEVLGNE